MKDYKVSFYREVVNNLGQRYLSELDSMTVEASPSVDEALSDAAQRFERKHHLEHWSCLASDYEVRTLRLRDEAEKWAERNRNLKRPSKERK